MELGNIGLDQAKANYFASMIDAYILEMNGHEAESHTTVRYAENACVGSGIRRGFKNIK